MPRCRWSSFLYKYCHKELSGGESGQLKTKTTEKRNKVFQKRSFMSVLCQLSRAIKKPRGGSTLEHGQTHAFSVTRREEVFKMRKYQFSQHFLFSKTFSQSFQHLGRKGTEIVLHLNFQMHQHLKRMYIQYLSQNTVLKLVKRMEQLVPSTFT